MTDDHSRTTADDSRSTTDDSRTTADDSRSTTGDSRSTTGDSRTTANDSRSGDERAHGDRKRELFESGLRRRTFVAVGGGVGTALLAGCTFDDSSDDGTPDDGSGGSDGAGNVRLLVSDAPADIDDFDRLDVTFETARVFEGRDDEEGETRTGTATPTQTRNGTATQTDVPDETVTEDGTPTESGTTSENSTTTENETTSENTTTTENETTSENTTTTDPDEPSDDEGGRGFYVLDLDAPTVDLTGVIGDRAKPIFDGELSAGSYRKLELHVGDVQGIVDGDEVEVTVPSGKLQLTKPFEVRAGEDLDFVFDINVVKRGQQDSYNLKPVITQSGVRGQDVQVDVVGDEADDSRGDGGDDGSEGAAGSDGDGERTASGTETDQGGTDAAETGSGNRTNETGSDADTGSEA